MWVLAQTIPVPDGSQDPWTWVAFLAVVALAWITRTHLQSKSDEANEWKTTAKTAVAELAANTTSLANNTNAVEKLGDSVDRLTNVVVQQERDRSRSGTSVSQGP